MTHRWNARLLSPNPDIEEGMEIFSDQMRPKSVIFEYGEVI